MPRKISYDSVKKAYEKVKTPKQAVQQAHLKWRFWATCTLFDVLSPKRPWESCGLCRIYSRNRGSHGKCPLNSQNRSSQCPNTDSGCHRLYGKAERAFVDVRHNGTPLHTFHAAAQKLADQIGRIKV